MTEQPSLLSTPSSFSFSLLSPLFGREQELQQGQQLLCHLDVRLLTLTGVGGVGKTRLGQAIVERVVDSFPDGVLSISLASLNHPDLLVPTLLQELGVREEREQSLLATLLAFLCTKHLLLFLDNFEQVVAGASLLVNLLEHCPDLKILVTSREMLRVRSEHILQVQPLTLPDLTLHASVEALAENPAIQLFVQRVQSFQPTFSMTEENLRVMAEICTRLEGLPLALELAAHRCQIFSLQELLERLEHRLRLLTYGLRDLPQRQQTLHNTLTWSYELLTHEERRLFRTLSIFASGCTLTAAEFVCGSTEDFLDVVSSLLEKNLLQRVESPSKRSRLRMLETLREYGLECLQASAEYQQVQHLHASYYLQQAEQAEPHLAGMAGAEWLDRLEEEYDNVRCALRWYLECEEWGSALRLGGALRFFWILNGHGREGYRWMTEILAAGECGTTQSHAKALLTAGMLAPYHGEYTQWLVLSQESLQLFQTLEDKVGIAEALKEIGGVAHWQGKLTEARKLCTRSMALFQEIGDRLGIANTRLALARVLHAQMENHKARQLAQESLYLFREIGNSLGIASALSLLAFIAGYYQEHRNAMRLAEESLVLFKAIGEQWEVAKQLHYVAELALRQNDAQHALVCVEECLHISQQIGNREAIARAYYLFAQVKQKLQGITVATPFLEQSLVLYKEIDNQEGMALVLLNMAQGTLLCEEYAQARTLLERCFQILVQKENKAALIENLRSLAKLAIAERRVDWAVHLLAASDTLRQSVGRQPLALKNAYRLITTMTTDPPNEQMFAAFWAEGRAMTVEQVFAMQEQATASKHSEKKGSDLGVTATHLTARELEVLHLLAQGLTNPQIARILIISSVTVNAHVRSIYNKLDVTSRSAATNYALRNRLV